jgi:hypothetical protein
MTDRELLELAAKAIGGTLSEGHTKVRTGETWDEWEWQGALGIQTGTDWLPHPGTTIHPLIDDGDALRLAVKLKIDVKHYDYYVVGWFDGGYIGTGKIAYGDDPYAATRRAITRAAAEIGKTKCE